MVVGGSRHDGWQRTLSRDGRVLGILLMLYAVGIFSYFIASIASILVGLDSQQAPRKEDDAGRTRAEKES